MNISRTAIARLLANTSDPKDVQTVMDMAEEIRRLSEHNSDLFKRTVKFGGMPEVRKRLEAVEKQVSDLWSSYLQAEHDQNQEKKGARRKKNE